VSVAPLSADLDFAMFGITDGIDDEITDYTLYLRPINHH